ncbi:MAG: glycosyltransferase family 4 protein [Candidatus Sabulitectum sp.]|nr:glycosyltransferase family 4 protein [Candidatus Sabulitectum sp.]
MGMDGIVKTVLDVTVCTHSRGGVGRWVRGLSNGLFQINRDHISIDVSETHPGHTCTVPDATIIPPPFWMKLPLLRRALLQRGILESTRAARIGKAAGITDIIHLSGVQPEGNGRQKVVTFFDDTPWVSPESHTKHTLFYANRLKSLVDYGAAVLAISNWSAAIARNLFDIPAEKTGYAGGAAENFFTPGEPDLEVLEKLDLKPGKYFLHVGSYVPRKNIPFLIRCFKEAGTDKKLVLAGAEKWGDEIASNTPGIVLLKNVSDEDLLALYRGATALLFPSSSEGLGLPVLEAFACNTPVIASDAGALPETVGRNGLLLPVLESEPWVRSISEMATGITSDSLRKKSEAAPRPTWKDTGESAMNFYRSLM